MKILIQFWRQYDDFWRSYDENTIFCFSLTLTLTFDLSLQKKFNHQLLPKPIICESFSEIEAELWPVDR